MAPSWISRWGESSGKLKGDRQEIYFLEKFVSRGKKTSLASYGYRQTLKENSVNYKYCITNSTTSTKKSGTWKILAKRWQEQVSIGQLGENVKWMTTKQGVQVSKIEAHR